GSPAHHPSRVHRRLARLAQPPRRLSFAPTARTRDQGGREHAAPQALPNNTNFASQNSCAAVDFIDRKLNCRVARGCDDAAGTLHRNDVEDLDRPVLDLAER
ncbi:hypothetical protein, partial [Nocardia sp. NPDC057440]|uniref:hypothetical protein n=1 Tax=Nocardia sp. NPDC057440 TaxID=3346134 RepID=UPI003670AD16